MQIRTEIFAEAEKGFLIGQKRKEEKRMGKGSLVAFALPVLAALLVISGLALEFYGLGSPTSLVLNGGGLVTFAIWAIMHETHQKEMFKSVEERLSRIEDLLLKKP